MNAFDRIIGYSSIKRELMQISDTLKNRSAYEKLGVAAPRGLLLYGEPGVGKSLMASAVIEDSGLPAFVLRKNLPNGDFVKEIKAVFEKAAEKAPAIIHLDDMDKFANGDERRPDAEEYVTVQSCIDEVKNKAIFVLATANNIRCLPNSLLRAGRIDRKIEVTPPRGRDAEEIVAHYIRNKKFAADVDVKAIAHIMDGRSCAELETVINEAGLYAGYEKADQITMDHFMAAYLRTVANEPAACSDLGADLSVADENYRRVVYHEAGHAVVSEVLCPGSVTLVSIHNDDSEFGGTTRYFNDKSTTYLYREKSRIISGLGGIAATEQIFGSSDVGCSRDLDIVFRSVKDLVVNDCVCGLHLHESDEYNSERLMSEQEQAISSEIERYYRKAKEILSLNLEFLEKIAAALAKKALLSAVDIKKIRDQCKIVSAAI